MGDARHAVGVFGRRVALDCVLEEGDRIEIYRPLRRTPMEARRIRAGRSGE
ncbi:MAG: RnfH family protein [Gammaproteobacteria bacterium]|nr:RnfH family protein [Gammaproteobacteria bacterium]